MNCWSCIRAGSSIEQLLIIASVDVEWPLPDAAPNAATFSHLLGSQNRCIPDWASLIGHKETLMDDRSRDRLRSSSR